MLSAVLEQVTARSQGVLGYVKLLGLLVQRYPNLLLGKAAAVQDVFGYISVLPPTVAERFLQAVSPLMRLRPGLQVRRAAVQHVRGGPTRATRGSMVVLFAIYGVFLRVYSKGPVLSCCSTHTPRRASRLLRYGDGLSRRCFRLAKGASVTTRLRQKAVSIHSSSTLYNQEGSIRQRATPMSKLVSIRSSTLVV